MSDAFIETEKVAYSRRIAMLENLRQSLVPGINSEVDSAYWNFCVSSAGLRAMSVCSTPTCATEVVFGCLVTLCAKSHSPEVILAAASALAELAIDGKSRRRIMSRWHKTTVHAAQRRAKQQAKELPRWLSSR